jgi:beta-lactamase regulating signal transducer with metallopeptidase domain/protein involved in polysaccharide export with SLBB domain/biopolymer transport protein ExbD
MNAWQLAGYTMLHFMWAGALVAALGAAVRLATRRCGPNVRYAASLAMLAAVACTPVAIACVLASNPALMANAWEPPALVAALQPSALPGGSGDTAPGTMVGGDAIGDSTPGQSPGLMPDTFVELTGLDAELQPPALPGGSGNAVGTLLNGEAVDSATPGQSPGLKVNLMQRVVGALPWVWLIGAPVTFLLLAAGLVGSRRLTRSGLPLVDGRVAEACARLRAALGVSRRVAIAAVEGLAQPVLVGIVKPTILLPAAALNGWTTEELEMVLVHELAHVRRWDNLVNLGQRVIEAALFFHPCVWLASRQVRRDREECCDAIVVQHTQAPEAYAELLINVASNLRSEPGRPRPGSGRGTPRLAKTVISLATASPMAQHALVGRVRRILKLEDDPMWISRRMMGLLVVLGICMLTLLRGALAVPEPIKVVTGEGVEGDVNSSYTVNYMVADIEAIDPKAWLRLTGSEDIVVRWHEENHSAAISAPRAVHEKISDLLSGARDAADRERITPEEEKLRTQIEMCWTQLIQIERELADAEVAKQVAMQMGHPDAAALEVAVVAEMDKDPTISMYKAQLFMLDQQIQQLAAASKNPGNEQLKRLKGQYQQVEATMQQYRAKAEAEARERLAKIPNEALRAAMVEHDVRVDFLTKKKAELEKRLKELEAEIDAPTAERNTARADRPATVERSYSFDPVLFECAKILGEAPELSLDWKRMDDRLVITAPQQVHDAIAMCIKAAKGWGSDSGETFEKEFAQVFAAGDDNPPVTVAYSFKTFDELAGFKGAAIDVIQGFVHDPYGPKLPISLRQLGDGQVEVTMPRAGHAWLRLMTSPTSPLVQAMMAKKKADEEGERAEDQKLDPLVIDESGTIVVESDLVVKADGSAKLEGEAVALEGIGKRLASLWATRSSAPRVRVQADAGLPYEQMVGWLDALRAAGVQDIGIDAPGDPGATTRRPAPARRDSYRIEKDDGTIVFPAGTSDQAMQQAIEELRAAGRAPVQVNGTWRVGYQIRPGDTLLVRALGVLDAHPVDGPFVVEDEGTIALGPAYGRVEVAGLSVREAEAAVLKSLSAVAKDTPMVQVTIAWKAPREAPARYRYHSTDDGKFLLVPADESPSLGEARGANSELRVGSAGSEPIVIHESPGPTIGAGDMLWVEVEGTLPDQPIKKLFTVSRDGALQLGPSYGVVEVAGLNYVDAETRIRQKLSEVLTECRVLVRVVKKAEGEARGAGREARVGEDRRWTHGVPLPEDMGEVEAKWVVEALERQGIGAEAIENGGKRVLQIATPTPLPPFKTVWESHQVEGRMQRMCRFIGEDGRDLLRSPFGVPAIADPYRPDEARGASGEASTDATVENPAPSPALRGRGMSEGTEGTSPSARLEEPAPRRPGATSFFPEIFIVNAVNPTETRGHRARTDFARLAGIAMLEDAKADPAAPTGSISFSAADADQLTVTAPRRFHKVFADYLAAKTPLYDGRTFDEWRGEWRTELKVEKRMESIEAMAAFARAGYGREAAEALLDVAGEYDFTVLDDGAAGKLKQRVIEVLAGYPKPIPSSVWLPVLVERFKADPAKWRSLMRAVLGQVYDADEAMQTTIRELKDDPKYDVAIAVWQALAGSAGNSGDQEELAKLLREGLASESAELRKLALSRVGFTELEKFPEPFEMLFAEDAEIALEARQQLSRTPEKFRAALAERLWVVVDDPERNASHLAALRAIGVLYSTELGTIGSLKASERAWRTDVAQRLIKQLQDGPREEWAAAAWSLDDEWDADASKFKGWIRTGKISTKRLDEVLALKQEIAEEREAAMGPKQFGQPGSGGGFF